MGALARPARLVGTCSTLRGGTCNALRAGTCSMLGEVADS
jgi:hypothetical protein